MGAKETQDSFCVVSRAKDCNKAEWRKRGIPSASESLRPHTHIQTRSGTVSGSRQSSVRLWFFPRQHEMRGDVTDRKQYSDATSVKKYAPMDFFFFFAV